MLRSIVEYCAEHESYKCGYCKKPNTNFSHGLWAHALTVSAYQDLIDRGWRRSGKYCYKPTMNVTCCPMYTIRCRALEFKPTKSQKKILKRFNKYLLEPDTHNMSGDFNRSMSTSTSPDIQQEFGETREEFVETTRLHQDINVAQLTNSTKSQRDDLHTNIDDAEGSTSTQPNAELCTDTTMNTTSQRCIKKGAGADPDKVLCKKAKLLRRERKLEKLKQKGIDVKTLTNNNKNREKQIEDFLNDVPDDIKEKLEIRLVRTTPPSDEWLATAKQTHEVYVKYQTTIHNDKPDKCTMPRFRDFLVDSPLLEEHSRQGPPCGYGSFHQQYWLQGKLVAVGVIDILPKCVSSVYFFYDPEYISLSLGTYAALREIAFTRHLNSVSPELKYYYMGFYIHSCPKMKYKGNFFPSDLLCPETYKWFPLKDCIPKLDVSPYSRLDADIDSVDENYPKVKDIQYIPMWVKGKMIPYKEYGRSNEEELVEYSRLVGAKAMRHLILVK